MIRPLLLGVIVALGSLAVAGVPAERGKPATISIESGKQYQSMRGWEATIDLVDADRRDMFLLAREEVFRRAVSEVGINRVRLEVRSGAESRSKNWLRYEAGEYPYEEWSRLRYVTVNDNDDPREIDWSGFDFSELDRMIEEQVLPMREALAARGEKLFINLCYVAFAKGLGGEAYIHDDPEEYAELVLATYLHVQEKYGFAPDSWEVILEPDLVPQWTPRLVGEAIVAAARRLKEHGFTPRFVAPSVTDAGNAVRFVEGMAKVKGAMDHVVELSYHRYRRATPANVKAIASLGAKYELPTSMLELWFGRARAEVLFEDLTVGGASAFQGRTLIGLFDMRKTEKGEVRVSLRQDVRKNLQIFKYVRIGAVRIGATSNARETALPVAFRNADGGMVVAVLASAPGDFVFEGLDPGRYEVSYAGQSRSVRSPELLAVSKDGRAEYSMPEAGVFTFAAVKSPSDRAQ